MCYFTMRFTSDTLYRIFTPLVKTTVLYWLELFLLCNIHMTYPSLLYDSNLNYLYVLSKNKIMQHIHLVSIDMKKRCTFNIQYAYSIAKVYF